jgi:hypothetical protein
LVKRELTKIVESEAWAPGGGVPGGFRSPMFAMVRVVKGHLIDFTGEQAWQRVHRVVTKKLGGWNRWVIEGFVRTEGDRIGCVEVWDLDSIHADFVNSFDKCRVPTGTNPLNAAVKLADQRQPYFKPDDNHGYFGYPRFLSVCAFLPEVTRQGIADGWLGFFLPQRHTATALGTRPNTVGLWIKLAVGDGYLTLMKEYPRGVRKASEYNRGQALEDWASQWES